MTLLRFGDVSSTMMSHSTCSLRRIAQVVVVVQLVFYFRCHAAITGVPSTAGSHSPSPRSDNDDRHSHNPNVTSSLTIVTRRMTTVKKQLPDESAEHSNAEQMQTDDVIREEMLKATQQLQPFQSLGRRVGYVTIIRENHDRAKENGSDIGSNVPDDSGEGERTWSDVWRSRVRQRESRLHAVLKNVNDYIGNGPRGTQRHSSSAARSTTSSHRISGRCSTALSHAGEPQLGQRTRVTNESIPASAGSRLPSSASRHRGRGDDCHNNADDVMKKSSSTSAVSKNFQSAVIVVASSCSRKPSDKSSTNSTKTAHLSVEATASSGVAAKSRHSPPSRHANGSSMWIEFELNPDTHCCLAAGESGQQRNSTVSVSTRVAFYKKSMADSLANNNHPLSSQQNRRKMASRVTSSTDVSTDMIRISVFQRRDSQNDDDEAVKLLGTRHVNRSFEGWLLLEVGPLAAYIEDRCRQATRSQTSARRGVHSIVSSRTTIDLLVRVGGSASGEAEDQDELGPRSGRTIRPRRLKTKPLVVQDVFKVPGTCRTPAASSSSVTTRSHRHSAHEKHGRADLNTWSCGTGNTDTRQQQMHGDTSTTHRPFIELTWSPSSPSFEVNSRKKKGHQQQQQRKRANRPTSSS